MATSGTAAFTLEFAECSEEAYERCGIRQSSGWDLKTARRSADLLLLEWQNDGVNLWTVSQATQVLTAADFDYSLAADTLDIADAVLRTGTGTSQQDVPMSRISQSDYAMISNKNQTGKPVQYWLDRQTGSVTIRFWPVPDSAATYTFVYWRIRRIEDSGPGGAYNPDMPSRFLPPFIAGLAWKLAEKRAPERADILERRYMQAWSNAVATDSNLQSPIRVIPKVYSPV